MQLKKSLLLLIPVLLCISFNSFSQSNSTTATPYKLLFTDFLSASKKTDTVSTEDKMDLFNFLKVIQCLSGRVYFSGNGFPAVIALQYTESEAKLKACFERCVAGSKLTFENCMIFQDGGLPPLLLNKVVVFQ